MTAGRNEKRGLADGYRVGRVGNCSSEWADMVEGLRDNLLL